MDHRTFPCFGLRLASVIAAGAISLGCGPEVLEIPGAGAETGREITGSYIDTYIWGANTAAVPRGPEGLTIEALVPQPDGSFTIHKGTVRSDGTFEIRGVPRDTYYLKVETEGSLVFYVTRERSIELGSFLTKRPDTAPATISPTDIVVTASALGLWNEAYRMAFYSPGSGAYGDLWVMTVAGQKGLINEAFDAATFSDPSLLDGAKGDAAYIVQYDTREAGGQLYDTPRRVLKPAPFTQVDGQPAAVTGFFEEVALATVSLDLRRSHFAALAPDVNPSAIVLTQGFYMLADPGGIERPSSSFIPEVVYLEGDMSESDLKLTLSYGNPFPSEWALVSGITVAVGFEAMVPWGTGTKHLHGSIGCTARSAAPAEVSFTPTIHPPRDVLLNGTSASGERSGVGVTPTISWSAPAQGTPGHYRVMLREFVPNAASKPLTTFFTKGTSVTVPEGILKEGSFYYMRIRAETSELSLNERDASGVHGCHADALTGLILP